MKRNLRFYFLAFLLSAACTTSYGQCGDSCTTATPLTVTANGPCTYMSCTNIGATPSGMNNLPCSGTNNSDVWFTFIVPPGVTTLSGQVLGGTAGAMTNPCLYFYRGTCSALSSLGCDGGVPPVSLATLTYGSFIPGEQIWARVKPFGGTPDGTFQICVYNPCPTGAPSNDDACNALVIPIATSCSTFVTLNNFCATTSAGVPSPGCGNYLGNDVWVQTTVGSNGNLEVSFEEQTLNNVACAIYSGVCNSLTMIACNDNNGPGSIPYFNLTGLSPNSTVWIRIWSYGNLQIGTTGICLSDPCPLGNPPPNDDPCNATVIPLAAACGNYVALSNVCAGGTLGITDPACGSYQSGDVWVQTTVGATGYLFVNFQEQTLHNVAAAIYTGTCSTLTFIGCNDDGGDSLMPQFKFSTLPPGTSVWIRAWDNNGGDTGTVGICVYDPCSTGTVIPPLYDNPPCPMPPGAWYVPIVNGECITYTKYNSYCASTVWGTTPAGIPPPVSCSGPFYPPGAATGWDVWAPFIIPDTPASGYIDIKTRAGTIDLDMAVYKIATPVDSNCSNGAMYTFITCDDLGGPQFMPYIRLPFGGINSVQAGDTILLRLWSFNGGPVGEWEMCINYPCGAGAIPLPGYDEPPCPATADLLPVTNGPCNNFQQGNNFCASDTATAGSLGCPTWGNTADLWYVVQMPLASSGTLEINMQTGITSFDAGISVYTGMPVACGGTGLTVIACDDDGGPGLLPYISLANPVNPGEYFFIRVWSRGGVDYGNLGLCVSDLCPGGNVAAPMFDEPPCPMPDSSTSYLPLSSEGCPDFNLYASNCASGLFGTTPAGVPVPSGCSGSSYPAGAATGWDVWTPFIVPDSPATGGIDIRMAYVLAPDLDMALYRITPPVSVNCGNGAMYNLIVCDDHNGKGNSPYLHAMYGGTNVIQAGDTLLVRTWRHFGGGWAQWALSASLSELPPAELCIVTVDSSTGKNLVVWEKSSTANVDSFCVYRETATPDSYEKIGSVQANAPGGFTDMTSDPLQHNNRYRLTIKDSCNYETVPGLPHQSIYLSASPGTSGGTDLAWNSYEGFSYGQNYILHGMTLNNLSVIDSVPGTQTTYSDTNSLPGINYYAVEVRKLPGCLPVPGGNSFGVSRSNIASEFVVGLEENLPAVSHLSVYPNPVLNSTVISFSLIRPGAVRISVFDIAGREVSLLRNGNLPAGQQRVEWNVSDQRSYDPAAGGVYLIRVESRNYSETKRVIILPH